MVEKREYPRIPMPVPARYRVLPVEEAQKVLVAFDQAKILEKHETGEIIDVSKNGALVYVKDIVPVKGFMALGMYISVPGMSFNCKAICEIVRLIPSKDEGKPYLYKAALKFHKVLHSNLKNMTYMDVNSLLGSKEIG